MKWEELSENEKEGWELEAKKYPGFYNVMNYMITKHCVQCKYKPKNFADMEFHFYTTHGIRRSDFRKMLIDLDKK